MTASLDEQKTTFRGRLLGLPSASSIGSWRPPSLTSLTEATRSRVPAIAAATRDRLPEPPSREDLTRWRTAVASWRPPEWATVRATAVELVHVAGVEGFRCNRVEVDLWDTDEASPEFARELVRRAFEQEKADRLVVLNADPDTAEHLRAAAAARGVTYRVQVFLRLNDLLPFA